MTRMAILFVVAFVLALTGCAGERACLVNHLAFDQPC